MVCSPAPGSLRLRGQSGAAARPRRRVLAGRIKANRIWRGVDHDSIVFDSASSRMPPVRERAGRHPLLSRNPFTVGSERSRPPSWNWIRQVYRRRTCPSRRQPHSPGRSCARCRLGAKPQSTSRRKRHTAPSEDGTTFHIPESTDYTQKVKQLPLRMTDRHDGKHLRAGCKVQKNH